MGGILGNRRLANRRAPESKSLGTIKSVDGAADVPIYFRAGKSGTRERYTSDTRKRQRRVGVEERRKPWGNMILERELRVQVVSSKEPVTLKAGTRIMVLSEEEVDHLNQLMLNPSLKYVKLNGTRLPKSYFKNNLYTNAAFTRYYVVDRRQNRQRSP